MSTLAGTVIFHAVVLAGGRSSRLGGRPKAGLRKDGRTLVELTVEAVREAADVVVVGPEELVLPEGVRRTREDPPFSGPAAGIAAGLRALEVLEPAEWTMTLACDMPGVAGAVERLCAAAEQAPGAAGFMAVTPDGRRQPLAALYRTEVLRGAYSGQDPVDRSVRSFVRDLVLQEVIVAEDATADIDTWDDVRRFRLDRASSTKGKRVAKEMTPEERQLLSAWVDEVTAEFDLSGVEVPVEDLLALAGAVSTGVARPAVPVTAYIAGYLAAVRAQHAGTADAPRAVRDVTAAVPVPTADRQTNGSKGHV